MTSRALTAAAILLSSSAAPAAFAASITWDTSVASVSAEDPTASGPTGNSQSSFFIPSIPETGTLTATAGGSTSIETYDLSSSGIEISFDQIRGAGYIQGDSSSRTQGGSQFYFTPTSALDYLISGSLSVVDPDGRQVHFQAILYDNTDAVYLFNNLQHSASTVNESFTLGEAGADQDNTLDGSLTGSLIAGHSYWFNAAALLDNGPFGATTSAHATGNVTLSFVPEPSTALLFGIGLATLASTRRHN